MAGATESTLNMDEAAFNRHKVYYLPDGVIFLVENVLFKVPRHMFQVASPFFRTLFSLSTGSREAEGSTDANPITIEQVMSVDFERLLALLYPLTLEYSTFTEKWKAIEWRSILDLATMWEIAQARNVAIQHLSKCLTPIEKVTFGRKYHYPTWVQEGFTILCLRADYLPVEDARQLGTEDLQKYGMVREKIRARLMKPLDRNWNGTWTRFRDGCTYARTDGYEDGMCYRNDPLVKELIEDHFVSMERSLQPGASAP